MNDIRARNMKAEMSNTLALILAGGSGSRLHCLTRWHAKPAIPFGGKFRTIDFPLSNCINSGLRKIFILTQYKSHSLNKHIRLGWNFLRPELGEFIELIPAQQRISDNWYQGTADAVYQNLDIVSGLSADYIVVLAGDHVYKMDYNQMLQHHIDRRADVTIGCIEVPSQKSKEFGIMNTDESDWVLEFREKPKRPSHILGKPGMSLASMGVYVFSKEYLFSILRDDCEHTYSHHDFGKDIIPHAIRSQHKVSAFRFSYPDGSPAYWRDVGTIDSYYDANIDLTSVTPELDLYDQSWPIWTYQEQLPPAKFVFDYKNRCGQALDSLVSGGCIVSGSTVRCSLLSNRVRIHSYTELDHCVLLPDVTVGRHCKLRRVIVDQNCCIPDGTVIGYDFEADRKRHYISPNGVVLVSPNTMQTPDRATDTSLTYAVKHTYTE